MLQNARAQIGQAWRRRKLPAHLRAVDRVDGVITLREADLLFRLARKVDGSGCVVEVGSYRGRSTVALALGVTSSPVFAIEPHEPFKGVLGGDFGPADRAEFFKSMLETKAYERVRLVNLSSEVVTPGWRQPVALLWIDGDHSYEGVRRDWDAWKGHLRTDALVAFDDSTDQAIGPYRLIQELVDAGELKSVEQVGKVMVLERGHANGSSSGAATALSSAAP